MMHVADAIHSDPEFIALRALSAGLGADPALVQGAGGNTSLKRDGVLWIKASGTWLMNAAARDIMVPVTLAPLLGAIEKGDAEAERAETFVIAEANPAGLRPSIETTVHALMPQAVVLHVHCVETIAWACLADAEARLTPLLADLDWAWVPYARPGLPLARAIAAAKRDGTDVLVLGNHGLVVAAGTVEAAELLLRDVVHRLKRPARSALAPDIAGLERLAQGTSYRLPKQPEAHAAATDPVSCKIASRGSLYPDHVVFLGPKATEVRNGASLAAAVRGSSRAGKAPMLLLVPGLGVVLHKGAPAGADEMARCLADVTARIGPDDEPVFLSAAQERELVDWDAEKYRQALSAKAGR